MARILSKELTAAIRAPFFKKSGLKRVAANNTNALAIPEDWRADNGFQERWENAAGTDCVRGMEVDSSNNVLISEEVYTPMRKTVTFNLSTAASITPQVFFIADRAYRVVGITEIHATAESTLSTLTGYVEKLTGTTAVGLGTPLMDSTYFNLKGTANTLQTATMYSAGTGDSDDATLQLAAGDRLSWYQGGTSTELAGVVVVVTLAPAGTGQTIHFSMNANGDMVDQYFYVANRDCIVTGIRYVHGTKSSAAGNFVLIKKCTGTTAPASGTTLHSDSGFTTDSVANTVQTASLTATAADLRLAPGNRLAIDYPGTKTALAGVVVVVSLQPVERWKDVTFTLDKNANLADQAFFTADRNYRIMAISEVHGTLGTNGSAVNLQVTRDTLTDAPGAGTDLIAANSAAGFDLKATINTVQIAQVGYGPAGSAVVGFVDPRFNYLMAGDRLSVDFAGTLTAVAGVTVTVSLQPC